MVIKVKLRSGHTVDDATIVHGCNAVSVVEDSVIVRDDDGTAPRFTDEVAEEIHDAKAVFGIESGCWFIANDEPRAVDKGAGDGDALLLTAGELVGAFFPVFREADTFEYLTSSGHRFVHR
jgi:hypothetical protein